MDLDNALRLLEQQLADARPVPLSASVMVNKDELERAAQAIRASIPEEIRQSRYVLKERDQILAQAERDAAQIIEDGKRERDRMVSETELVREARREGQRIVDRAGEDARRVQSEAEDYVDAKLGDFEALLQKTLSTVMRGRERLQGRQASAEIRDMGELSTAPSGLPVGQDGGGHEGGPEVVEAPRAQPRAASAPVFDHEDM